MVLRVIWGFIGSEQGPLLIMLAVTTGTGMADLAAERGKGPLAGVIAKVERPARLPGQRRPPLLIKQVHETVANITLMLVVRLGP